MSLVSLLRQRDLRLLLTAGLVSQTGDWILGTGIAFQVYVLTGSTLASAVALLASQGPQAVFGSVAGVLVDRWDRRRVMTTVNLLLGVALLPLLAVREAAQVWVVFVVVAVSGCLSPFFATAEASLLPTLAGPHDLVRVNAVNAQVRNVSRLVGAGLGGVVVAAGGLTGVVLVDGASFLFAALLVGRLGRAPVRDAVAPLRLAHEWAEGLAVITRSRPLCVVAFFFAVSGVGEAAMGTLFAPFVHDVLGGSAQDFGTILAAQAVGGIAGGLLVSAVGHRFPARALFAWGAVAFGTGDLALFLYPLLTRLVWPAVGLIALVGLPAAALMAGALAVFQGGTADHVRGRVFGVLTSVQNLVMLVSTVVAGSLASLVGIVPVIAVQGAVHVLAGGVVLVALRSTPTQARPVPLDGLLDNPAVSTRLPNMSLASNVRTRTVTDPLALRAFAHPLRQKLYSLVGREGSLTAADAARQLGTSHALASHHLRQLAKYGFVEAADSPDNRAHPWRVAATSLELRPTEPDAQASVDVLERHAVEQAARQLAEWQERRTEDDAEWATSTGVRGGLLYLTPDELAEVMTAWSAIVVPLAERRPIGHAAQRTADTVPVSLTLVAVPLSRTEHGG